MKYFSLFTGVGGFEIGIDNAYDMGTQPTDSKSKSAKPQVFKRRKRASMEMGLRVLPADERGRRAICVGFSEIDKYASSVLRYRFPNTKNYGDIQKISWKDVPDFDLLVGGSPCQDLSIAGKRAGLEGSRSGLFAEYVRSLHEKKPRHFIWENVKGALSSNGGRDFAYILNALAEEGYALSWQILNARDFGVPQNRERIFIIGTRGERAREIFFEPQGAQANLSEITSRVAQAERVYSEHGVARTLKANGGGIGAKTGCYAVRCPLKYLNRNQKKIEGDYAFTIDGANTGGIAFIDLSTKDPKITSAARTIQARYAKGYSHRTAEVSGVTDGIRVRRLTPLECERLMSWPDEWTRWGIDEKGNVIEMSDTQRYKMCGNGVVSRVVEHVARTILCNTNK